MTLSIKRKTLVLGASPNPARYSYMAVTRLLQHGVPVEAVGLKNGTIQGIDIQKGTPDIADIHTVTIYMNAMNQRPLYPYILSLRPVRIIFNPGAENPELELLAGENGIETLNACTLVLLSTGQF